MSRRLPRPDETSPPPGPFMGRGRDGVSRPMPLPPVRLQGDMTGSGVARPSQPVGPPDKSSSVFGQSGVKRVAPASAEAMQMIDDIIDRRDVAVVFQAIFDATDGQVVGFESLLRGPPGPLQAPLPLLAAAHARGRGGELDWVGRAAAFQTMLDAHLPASLSLFVNIDPESLLEPCPEDLQDVIWAAQSGLRVFVEITEMMLLREPVRVLQSVMRARKDGWGIALDNIGYGAMGLALLPVIEPDVLKLDRQLLAEGTGLASAAIAAASRQRFHTGASLMVERFEDDGTVPLAQALGVGFRQGRALAAEGPLPDTLPYPRNPVPLLKHAEGAGRAPWDVLMDHGASTTQTMSEAGVTSIVRNLISAAFAGQEAPVVALILPEGQLRDAQSASVYRMLLARSPLQILLGPSASMQDGWRAWGVELPADHPWLSTLTIVAVSGSAAVSLAARPLDDRDPNGHHELVLSHDLGTALAALREILNLCDAHSGAH
jgi:EAL domain-containing protein (putative c-di-GMP-specific phosphodiesterase class I)